MQAAIKRKIIFYLRLCLTRRLIA